MERIKESTSFAEAMELNIINALCKEYDSVFLTDRKTRRAIPIRLSDRFKERIGDNTASNILIDELTRMYAENMVHPEDRASFLAVSRFDYVMEEIQSKAVLKYRYRTVYNGVVEYFQYKVVGLGNGPDYDSIVIGFSNITKEASKEAEMKEKLTKALQDAQQASVAKSTFLFNMSHDIRTPMNAILGFTKLAKRNAEDSRKVIDYMSKLEIAGEHLLGLINDVLDMSKIESGKIILEPVRVNLISLAGNVRNMVEEEMKKRNLSFSVDVSDVTDSIVLCDELRMNQVILNLLGNAMKFTPEGGSVSVVIEQGMFQPDGKCEYRFLVKDTGIGMSKEFQKHAFDAFEMARSSTISHKQGTGLGLAISKGIMEIAGGTIEIESEEGEGSTFTISVPLYVLPEEESEDVVEARRKERDFTGKVLLLVEDNEMNRELAEELLTDEGFVVETAEDGTVAVDLLKYSVTRGKSRYDAVLMDIQMPIMDGYEATAKIREFDDPAIADIPIIAMTANAFDEDRKHALEAGMNAHVSKPINMDKLLDTLADLLNN